MLMSIQKALHSRNDIGRLYVLGKEGGRVLFSIEDRVDVSIWGLEDYVKKSKERLITQPVAVLTT